MKFIEFGGCILYFGALSRIWRMYHVLLLFELNISPTAYSPYINNICEIFISCLLVCMARNEMMVPGWVCCQAGGCFTSLHVWNHRNCRTAVDSSLRFCLWRAVLEKIGEQSIGWNALGRGLRPPMYEMITIGSNLPALRQSHFAPNPIRQI